MGSDLTNHVSCSPANSKSNIAKNCQLASHCTENPYCQRSCKSGRPENISAMPSLQIIPMMLLASARTSALSPAEVLTTNDHKQRIKEHHIMGEKPPAPMVMMKLPLNFLAASTCASGNFFLSFALSSTRRTAKHITRNPHPTIFQSKKGGSVDDQNIKVGTTYRLKQGPSVG